MDLGHSSTFNSDSGAGREARRFFVELLLLIVLPVAVVVGLVEWAAWRSGDTIPPARLARMQDEDPTLVWGGAGQLFAPVKIAGVEQQKPDVIVLGASRSGQFRSAMFKPYSFYNCTMAAWTFDQYRVVLERILRVHTPKVIVFNLDYFMFSAAYEAHWHRYAKMALDYTHFDGLSAFIQSVKAAPGPTLSSLPAILFGRKTNTAEGNWVLGSVALRGGSSYRHDGSLDYSAQLRDAAGYNTQYLLHILGTVGTGAGTRMDQVQVERFRDFAALAKRHGITLIGVQVPIMQKAIDVLDAGQDFFQLRQFYGSDMAIWREFESAATKLFFDSLGVIFVDLARTPENVDARYFIDPAHPGEYAVLAAVIQMLKDRRVQAALPQADIAALERKMHESAGHYFDVFHNDF